MMLGETMRGMGYQTSRYLPRKEVAAGIAAVDQTLEATKRRAALLGVTYIIASYDSVGCSR